MNRNYLLYPLKAYRQAAGLTRRQLSQISSVPVWVISKAERTAVLTERDAKMLSAVLGASDSHLKPIVAKAEPSDFLSIQDVAGRLGVSEKTISRWYARGIFPGPVLLGPRLLKWHSSVVDAFIAKNTTSAA